jgi:hypothetical protein
MRYDEPRLVWSFSVGSGLQAGIRDTRLNRHD